MTAAGTLADSRTLPGLDWRDRARRQSGVISRTQLARCGLSGTHIDSLVRRRELTELLPRVYSPRRCLPRCGNACGLPRCGRAE